jgi:hypothetical protein
MQRRFRLVVLAAAVGLGLWFGAAGSARAQDYNMGHYWYYPYYYFPHNYWPQNSPSWPERPGAPYMRPPAYMAYPPFHEPHWRYEMNQPHSYYRGFHFWLDAF